MKTVFLDMTNMGMGKNSMALLCIQISVTQCFLNEKKQRTLKREESDCMWLQGS